MSDTKGTILASKTFNEFEGKNLTLLADDQLPPAVQCKCKIESLDLSVTKKEIEDADDADQRNHRYEYTLWIVFNGHFTNYFPQAYDVHFKAYFDNRVYPFASGIQFLAPSGSIQTLKTTLITTSINQYEWLQKLDIKKIMIEMY